MACRPTRSRTGPSAELRIGRQVQFGEQQSHPSFDLVSHRTHGLDVKASRIGEHPFHIAAPRKHWTCITATHRDNDIRGLDDFLCPRLWVLPGNVDAPFCHGSNCGGIDLVARLRSSGEPLWLIGDSGTGKSQLLIGLGTAAAEAGFRVKYTLATKLVNELVEAADEKVLAKTIARYGRVDLICVDELGIHGIGPSRS